MTKAEIIDYIRRERDRYNTTSIELADGTYGYNDYVNAEACRNRAMVLGLLLTRIEMDEKKK